MRPEIPENQRHHRFFVQEEFITLKVDAVYLNIPVFILKKHSKKWDKILSEPQANSDFASLVKEFTALDLERFLTLLFPSNYGEYDASTFEEWLSILKVAHEWEFESIIQLALAKIEPLSTPVDKIIIGKAYNLPEWAIEGRVLLCRRPESITLEEALRLGIEEVVNISTARQRIRPSEISPGVQDSTIRSTLSGDWKAGHITSQVHDTSRHTGCSNHVVAASHTSTEQQTTSLQPAKDPVISLALEFREQLNFLQRRRAELEKSDLILPGFAFPMNERLKMEDQMDELEQRYRALYKGYSSYWSADIMAKLERTDDVPIILKRLKGCLHPDSPKPQTLTILLSSLKARTQNGRTALQIASDTLDVYGLNYTVNEATWTVVVSIPA